MRLHLLRLTAFGSFPGTEEVDFDALSEAGLFLIHGPTGAGKTTVLDAVCFALYGRVPGQRDKARSLRCDHAPPGRGPVVELEVTIRDRRFRITRSPAWLRPKQRGTGLVEEKAKTRVEELTPAGWTARTTRSDEAGHLIGELLGMNADQFCQVAMLPQGEFARFLRADGEERRRLLERLFSVRIYTEVERWLAERRTETGREQQEAWREVESVIDRMRGAAGPELLAALPETADPAGDPLGWSAALLAAAAEAVAATGAEEQRSADALASARAALEAGREVAERRRRYEAALARRDELALAAEERSDLESMLDEAARADRVSPLIRLAEQRAEAAAKARQLAGDAIGRAGPLIGPAAGAADLERLERERRAEAARLEQLLPEEARLTAVRGDLAAARERLTELAAEEARLAERRAELPDELARAEERLAESRLAAARILGLAANRDAAAAALAAVRRRDELAAALAEARRAEADALAALPEPAGPDPGRSLAELERARRDELVKLEERAAEEARLAEITARLAGLRREIAEAAEEEAAVRADLTGLPDELKRAEERLARARAAAARLPGLEAECRRAAERLAAAQDRDRLAAELAEAERARQAAVDRAQEARDRFQEIRQARIEGMAGELARELTPGEPCPVCGSPDHPAPAAPADAAPTAEDEQRAQDEFEAARRAREEAERRVASMRARLDEVTRRAEGRGTAEAAALLAAAEEAMAAEREAAAAEPELAAEATELAARLDRLRATAEELGRRLAEHRAQERDLAAEHARLAARLAEALGEDRDVRARRERLERELGLLTAAADAVAAARAAEEAYRQARAAVPEGAEEEAARRALEEADKALESANTLAAEEPALAEERRRLAEELATVEERARRLAIETAETRTRLERLTEEEARLTGLLDEHRGEDPSLAARLERITAETALLRDAAEAVERARLAEQERERAAAEAEAAAAEAGFRGVADAKAAIRTEAEREEMAERLRRFDAEQAAIEAELADPELAAAAAGPAPDLAALEQEHERAEREHAERVSARDRARSRLDQLTDLAAELEAAHRRYLPAAERHRLARRMAELTGGTSPDNRYHMRLSSYVLGERLRQVVDAANDRLDRMSGGRYLLEHDLGRVAGDRGRSGGGLALRVLDGWTGAARDPATLSGGESFIASLALALGLADVVAAEAGGPEIGTLFVDEGFGTLDEETLDDVLDILDGLREGGRAVGIVSHVAELRLRIPARLQVVKGRSGSRLVHA